MLVLATAGRRWVVGYLLVRGVVATKSGERTKFEQLLALINEADLLLCPDTGPAHMAAAVNTPVIALHAVTSSKVSGPYNYRHLAVDCYPLAVEQVLKTTVANNVWGTHAHGDDTMELVSVAQVVARVGEVFLNFDTFCQGFRAFCR